ncbi:MAG: DNA gyrase subunit B, partial [Desulfobulbaceae bacterium]|nr:DNA gyrase subunit B [Desulfobulbaceae bacterium]
KVSGGLHGVGVSVVNALSEWTVAEVCREGGSFRQRYEYGNRATDLERLGDSSKTGTTIHFKPDPKIFTETVIFKYEIVKNRLRELAFLNKGVKIKLRDERSGEQDEFVYEGGIASYVEYLNRNRTAVSAPIYMAGEKDQVQVEICFQYFDGYSERLFSFVNNINTKEGGSHVAGFRAALTKCINRYASDDVVPKNLKEKMGGDDVREGLTCVVSVRVPEPQFEGQTKTKLGNSEVKSIVESICNEKLGIYLEQNPGEARKILTKAVDAARAREAARRAKELSRKKGGLSVMMAGKLSECQSKDPQQREIFIVEGDSAGGSAKQGRDRTIQAILPLRGKIMNVEKARFDKILGSEEIKQLIAALGTGIGKDDFEVEKLRYHKIIIMTDADVDGAHIRTLLLTFFYRQMLPLIEKGFVYIGQPPLYRLGRGKKEQYFIDDDALNNYLYQQASQIIYLKNERGEEIRGEVMVDVLRKLSHFEKICTYLERLNIPEKMTIFMLDNDIRTADQFQERELLETLISKIKILGPTIGQIRSCRWRPSCYEVDISFRELSHMLTVLGPNIPLINEYRLALEVYATIKDYLSSSFEVVRQTTTGSGQEKEITTSSWHELIKIVRDETFKGSHLQRYKGLGEMNPEQLWETTMNPNNRTLVQVTIEDAEKADDIFTTLMGDKVEPRREFIQNHALEVSQLDI